MDPCMALRSPEGESLLDSEEGKCVQLQPSVKYESISSGFVEEVGLKFAWQILSLVV